MKKVLFALAVSTLFSSTAYAQTFYERKEVYRVYKPEPIREVYIPRYTPTPSSAYESVVPDYYKYSRYRYGLLGRPRSAVEIRIRSPYYPF